MPDISELFGQLRSLLSSFPGTREEARSSPHRHRLLELRRLLESAQAIDPDRYASEWHAYLRGFSHLLSFSASSLEELEELEVLLPSSIPLRLHITGTTNATVTRQTIEQIGQYEHLDRISELVIHSLNRGQDALESLLGRGEEFSALKHVRFSGCSLQKKTLRAAADSSIFPRIERLEVHATTYRPNTSLLEVLLEARRLESLEVLDLSRAPIHPIDLDALCALELPHTLTRLDLSQSGLEDAHAIKLASAPQLDAERVQLDVTGNAIKPSGLIALVDAGLLPPDVVLEGRGQRWRQARPLTPADAAALAACEHLAALERCECVARHYQTPALLGRVLCSKHLRSLRALKLDLTEVRPTRFCDLFDSLDAEGALGSLESLTIAHADGLTRQCLLSLVGCKWFERLLDLSFVSCRFEGGPEVFTACFSKERFPSLSALTLCDCGLKDSMLGALLGAEHRSLERLNLSRNKLTLRKTQFAASLPTLVQLDLSHNSIGERGVANFMAHAWDHLEVLSLSQNLLGDQGVMTLLTSPLVSRLTSLDLSRNETTLDAVHAVLDSPLLEDPSIISLERLQKTLEGRQRESVNKLMFDLRDLAQTRAERQVPINEADITALLPRLYRVSCSERASFEAEVFPWLMAHCTPCVTLHSVAMFNMAAEVLPEHVELVLRVRGHGKDRSNKAVVGTLPELTALRQHPRFTTLRLENLHKVQREMKRFFDTDEPFSSLRNLSLSSCDVRGGWARSLERSAILSTVAHLEVVLIEDFDQVTEVISRRPMPALTRLRLSSTDTGLSHLASSPWIGQIEHLELPLTLTFSGGALVELLDSPFAGKLLFDWRHLRCDHASQLIALTRRADMISPKAQHNLIENPYLFWSKLSYEALLEEEAIALVDHPFLAHHQEFLIDTVLSRHSASGRMRDDWTHEEIEVARQRLAPFVQALYRSEVFRPARLRVRPLPLSVVQIFLDALPGSPVLSSLDIIEVDGQFAMYESQSKIDAYRGIIDWLLAHRAELAHLDGITCTALTYTSMFSHEPTSVLREDQVKAMWDHADLFISRHEISRALKCFEGS